MRNSAAPASDYIGRVVKAVSPVKTHRKNWAGDTSLVGAGVGSNPTRNQFFLITFDLALDLGELRFKFISLIEILHNKINSKHKKYYCIAPSPCAQRSKAKLAFNPRIG